MDFSVIVPTRDRPGAVCNCVEHLARLRYPAECFEVIVVDDGSRPPLDSVLAGFQSRLNLTILRQAPAGPAAARNLGASHARGSHLAFTDDDCRPNEDWLGKLAARLEGAPDCGVGGPAINLLEDNLYSAASQAQVMYLYRYYNPDPDRARLLASNNLAVPRDRFQQIGGFDTPWPMAGGEDRRFCDCWLEQRWRLLYAPEAVVHHVHRLSLSSFWPQHFHYGRGACYFQRARGGRNLRGVAFQPWSFYWNLVRNPLSEPPLGRACLLTGLQIVSQLATVAGFLREWVSGPIGNPLAVLRR